MVLKLDSHSKKLSAVSTILLPQAFTGVEELSFLNSNAFENGSDISLLLIIPLLFPNILLQFASCGLKILCELFDWLMSCMHASSLFCVETFTSSQAFPLFILEVRLLLRKTLLDDPILSVLRIEAGLSCLKSNDANEDEEPNDDDCRYLP